MEELWKQIEDHPDYRVSNLGNIVSTRVRNVAKKMTPVKSSKHGHMSIALRKDGVYHRKQVHRLVLEAFVGPCPEGMEGCHNNGKAWDNRLENLRWDTPKNNQADRAIHGTSNTGERNPAAVLNKEIVWNIRLLLSKGHSNKECCEVWNICDSDLSNIRNNKRWSHPSYWPPGVTPESLKRVEADFSKRIVEDYKPAASARPGERNGNTTLTESDVVEIRTKLAAKVKSSTLVKEYNVHRTTIYDIKKARAWPNAGWPPGITLKDL